MPAQQRRQILILDVVELDQDRSNLATGHLLVANGLLELLSRDQLLFDEDLADSNRHHHLSRGQAILPGDNR